jgi:hypothetical protein
MRPDKALETVSNATRTTSDGRQYPAARKPAEAKDDDDDEETEHEQKEADTKPEKPGVGIRLANEAIACLARIPLRDNCRDEAWKMVKNWLKNNQ